MLNETKTDEGDSLVLTGYTVICRRDRGSNGGGIAVFCKNKSVAHVTVLEQTEATSLYERCWVSVHTIEGPVLVCCWYRPPGEDMEGLIEFQKELSRLRGNIKGIVLMGDLNIHHRRWLRYSSRGETPEGRAFYDIATSMGLKQLIREPTHELGNLLDLVLTDMLGVEVRVGGKVQDHMDFSNSELLNTRRDHLAETGMELQQRRLAEPTEPSGRRLLGNITKAHTRRGC